MRHLAEVLRHDGVRSVDKRHLTHCWRMSLFLLDTLPEIQKGLLSSKQASSRYSFLFFGSFMTDAMA